ncbi:esterase/lipase family protein [Sphingomonas immobilis]|uniref:Alpha/beta hydrolase n=1 Tax=Sphingomonas immobilis TaxID=3063997 RepID=A0ABT9A0F1_9SPHN|nr:alpha/beta hydrolase [Sphingomonas sp. CA1-15]MDO7843308.1 alpha/beta hydrolase [Sphingomonas sp. CA1-15]
MTALSPPSKWLWAAEFPRGLFGLAEFAASQTRLRAAPRGDGRPVMILPGLMTTDRSNTFLRQYLTRLGYRVEGWGLGRNIGARVVGGDAERLMARIREVHERTGEPVTLIGVSLGGIMARIAAHRLPGVVREVITVSAPYAGSPRATNVWRSFEFFTGEKIDDAKVQGQAALAAMPLPVPETAIWSRSDGLVNGTICRASGARAIEVRSSHVGVQWRRDVMLAIAGVLGER